MTTTLGTTLARASLALGAVCLFGMSLQAQTYQVQAKVPFQFQVARTVMTAGDYRLDNKASSLIAQIHNVKTGQQIYVPVIPAAANTRSPRPCLVFHVYGTEAFLSEIRINSALVSKVPAASREKELMMGPKPVATILIPLGVRAD